MEQAKARADITEQVQTEGKLNVPLSGLETALDEHACVAITDPAGRITHVLDKCCTISKYREEQLGGNRDHRLR